MGRDHERGATAVGGAEQPEQGVTTRSVEPDERLVDDHHLEGADERKADGGLLAQPAAEGRRQLVGAFGQADRVEQLVGPLLPLRPAMQPGDVFEVLAHGKVVVEDRLVGEHARALPAPRSSPPDAQLTEAEPADGSSIPVSSLIKRGLAASVVADQRHPLAGAARRGRAVASASAPP